MKRFVYFIAGLLALTISARAFVLNIANGNPQHWELTTQTPGVPTNSVNPITHAVRFYVTSDAYSTTNTAAEQNAIRATFAQWQAISNSILKFEDAGVLPPQADINTSDGNNVVFWARTSLINGGADDITGVLGRTYVRYTVPETVLIQADIVLNGVNRSWFTDFNDTANTNYFVEGVLAHEIGHFIGLAHSPVGVASMFARGPAGLGNTQAGLSSDDIAVARFLYPVTRTNSGAIKGVVTKNGNIVLGAQVFVEDAASNIVAGTMSRSVSGAYEVNMLPPGTYQVRAAPLDPNANPRLVSSSDINSDYSGADTAFLPTTNITTIVTANTTNTVNIVLSNRTPAFRITHIRAPTANPLSYGWASGSSSMAVGQSNYYIGVASPTMPTANASLRITGDGLTLGAATFDANLFGSGLNFISVPISISSNATPGARSFIVTQYGTNVAYANGFLEIQPAVPDYNFDGLDDRFQRKYFPLFTGPNAGPNADPDGDGMGNYGENIAATIPTNAASLLKMQKLARTNNTTTIRWDSVLGKKYQVSYSTNPVPGSWSNLGASVPAAGATTLLNDTTATNTMRLYRVQALP